MSTIEAARAWLAQDPDASTRAELSALIDGATAGDPAATAELDDRFRTRLAFGTAGLRGALGAGPNRMNRVLVSQAAAGLAAFLLEREATPSIVIGYDGRTGSAAFARDTAEIMAGAGVTTTLLPRLLPTPVLAFAVRHLDASAGVMVTASHNPASDNGYKVYLGGADAGSQIVPPADGAIAAHITRVAAGSIVDLPRSSTYRIAEESVIAAYVSATAALVAPPTTPVSFVYTAMHGVGWETAQQVFARAGFAEPTLVEAQIAPDPAFPTVAFPNPEEPGAMDLAFETAARVGAELVIANDPDADRLAVGIPTEDGWVRLSGNEVGWLLGWRSALRASALGGDRVLACSIVSSPALAAVAAHFGLRHVETLTGFKWISRVPGLAYGYEEALGYLVDPQVVRDKDGISAAVDLLALASELKSGDITLARHAEAFAALFGGYASSQISLRVDDLAEIPRIMARLRAQPPGAIGGRPVIRVDDFAGGFGEFAPSDILRLWTDDGSRIIVRPSGTEPKLKVYIDASSTTGSARERLADAGAKVAALDAGMRALIA
ncbi:phospho-sugar mutase [Galbitalea soli]|uniref:Phospho-sugar mutase n=1 Tax=Galbitalea soli TaxID=1268042 RepID=A0A7C9PNC7_9MICO|nr:phospho-sugar mutase [Galbitalea soli]NEM91309.1 phospho-sugar mutase [Galbitalea soli]NYJ29998.1 phosphomannomutase [Galbitalea soli]